MKLELTLDEARVLTLVVDYVLARKDLEATVYAGAPNDIGLFASVAGQLRTVYQLEKRANW